MTRKSATRPRRRKNSPRGARRNIGLRFEQLEVRRVLSAGPYAPAAGLPGSTAIDQDDPSIAAWATAWEDYVIGQDVDPMWQTPDRALGPATGDSLDIVSLGRAGQITLTFDEPARNGAGADFTVFENGVSDPFLELAYVEVSSDGDNFVRFPNDSLTSDAVGAFGELDPTNLHGYASKYRVGHGTPFDFADLEGVSPLLDVNRVSHIRIVDIPGDGSALDSDGHPIFDPHPTLGSAGVDLEAVGVIHTAVRTETEIGFEVIGAGLSTEGHWNGPDAGGTQRPGLDGGPVVDGGFETEGVFLNNVFSVDFGSWTGWAYSNTTDTTTPGFANQFSALAGAGAGGSSTYAVGFRDIRDGVVWEDTYPLPTISLGSNAEGKSFDSVAITNTTYAGLALLDGDSFAKKFGGASGDDPDWFLLTIEGKNAAGDSVGTVEFYLADYRFVDNSEDYVIDEWVDVDVSGLLDSNRLEFKVTSSDVGTFGLNTPAFFALDKLVLAQETATLTVSVDPGTVSESDAPETARFEDVGFSLAAESFWNGSDGSGEILTDGVTFNNDFNPAFNAWSGWAHSNQTDTITPGFANQYSSFAGAGALSSSTYGVAFTGSIVPTVSLTNATSELGFESLMVTNTTYAGLSMLLGDAFSKKFGGADGTDPDWFLLTIEGFNSATESVGTVEFYLADYRFADSADDYIVDDWRVVDLSSLEGAVTLAFSLDSTDVGVFGMNTPAYFALDNVVLSDAQAAVGSVTRNSADLSNPLTVMLSVDDPTEANVPAFVEIPANEASVDFPVRVVDDMVEDGLQTLAISAQAAGFSDGTRFFAVADDDQPLLISGLQDTNSGFVVDFGNEIVMESLNLYRTTTAAEGPADVVLVGQTTGPVAGSLAVDPTARRVTFVRTGGPLLPDTYTATLRGASDGFKTPAGIPLDGDADGAPGGQFEESFVVAPPAANAVTISLPDFIRGPGQAVNFPADVGAGLPVSVSEGTGVRSIDFQISYDPALLEITGATVAAGAPEGATVVLETASPGLAAVRFSSPVDLPGGSAPFIDLQSTVPSTDASGNYRKNSILNIHSVSIRDSAENELPAVSDDALQVAAYFGDVSGNGRINANDASLIARFVTDQDAGFAAFLMADPVLISDVSGNNRVNALDASRVAQVAALLSVPTIPPIPDGILTGTIVGHDSKVSIQKRMLVLVLTLTHTRNHDRASTGTITIPSMNRSRIDLLAELAAFDCDTLVLNLNRSCDYDYEYD
jgi:hypothetical protein